MEKKLGFCGVDCATCPVYQATMSGDVEQKKGVADYFSQAFKTEIKPEEINCIGCVQATKESGPLFGHCHFCDVRLCNDNKTINTCAECNSYSCSKLEKKWSQLPPHMPGKPNLEEIRK